MLREILNVEDPVMLMQSRDRLEAKRQPISLEIMCEHARRPPNLQIGFGAIRLLRADCNGHMS